MLSSYNVYGPVETIPGAIMIPTGGLVHYVHSSGAAALDLLPPGMRAPSPGGFFTSVAAVAAASGATRDNRGDQIVCLPGHTETVATASAWGGLAAGVTVRSLGEPESDQRATINFTASGSTILLNKAGTVIDNFIIDCCKTAATVVAAPFTVSASGCRMTRNRIHGITSATQLATVPVTVASGADDFHFERNVVWATGAGTFATNPTNWVQITGAVANCKIRWNDFFGGTAAATGLIEATAAPTNITIMGNTMQNMFATGTSCVVLIANTTGVVCYNSFAVANNGTAANQGITVPGSVRAFQNFCSDEAGKSGALAPAAVAS